MPRVFVANFAGHPDYVKAEVYGELHYITRGYVSLGNLDRLVFDVVNVVRDTEPDDYLLLSGLCIISVVAALAWLTKHGRINILHWDKKMSTYRLLEMNRQQFERMFDVLTIREAEDKWRAQNKE